jgi:hypothetical protein
MPFDLLSGVFDAAFDVIEFVQTFVEGEQEVKGAGGDVAGGGGLDFALNGRVGRDGHGGFLNREKIKEEYCFITSHATPIYPN